MIKVNSLNISRKSGIREPINNPMLLIEFTDRHINSGITNLEYEYYKTNLINLDVNTIRSNSDQFILNQSNWLEEIDSESKRKYYIDSSDLRCRLGFLGSARKEILKYRSLNPRLNLLLNLNTTFTIDIQIFVVIDHVTYPLFIINKDYTDFNEMRVDKENLDIYFSSLNWNLVHRDYVANNMQTFFQQNIHDYFELNKIFKC